MIFIFFLSIGPLVSPAETCRADTSCQSGKCHHSLSIVVAELITPLRVFVVALQDDGMVLDMTGMDSSW